MSQASQHFLETQSDINLTEHPACLSSQAKYASTAASPTLLSLPAELRAAIFELILVQEDPIWPWPPFGVPIEHALGLISVNRSISAEASSILYARNCFDLTPNNNRRITAFFERIGSRNAGFIRHIIIDFPTFATFEVGNVALREGDQSVLAEVRSFCTNLGTLTTSLDSTVRAIQDLEALENVHLTEEAMLLAHAAFEMLPSAPKIIVQVYKGELSDVMKNLISRSGWTTKEMEYPEEEDDDYHRGLSGDGMAYSDYYDLDDYNDEYDIDNDSDFWRRAGD